MWLKWEWSTLTTNWTNVPNILWHLGLKAAIKFGIVCLDFWQCWLFIPRVQSNFFCEDRYILNRQKTILSMFYLSCCDPRHIQKKSADLRTWKQLQGFLSHIQILLKKAGKCQEFRLRLKAATHTHTHASTWASPFLTTHNLWIPKMSGQRERNPQRFPKNVHLPK